MPVTVTIPKMLASLVRSDRRIDVDATSVAGTLDTLCSIHPELRVHIFDEVGSVRAHVTCFHNGLSVMDTNEPVADGDEIVVLQAVSGG